VAERFPLPSVPGSLPAFWHRFSPANLVGFPSESGKLHLGGFVRAARLTYVRRVAPIDHVFRKLTGQKRRLSAAIAFCSAIEIGALVTPGCSSNHPMYYCPPGQNCCIDNADCDQSCYADGCNLTCSQTAHSCNSACGNQCVSSCHDTNDCSLTCANNCSLDCFSTASCAGECGASCNYSCSNTSRCNVRVGVTSTVLCDHVATCTIQCAGACTVNFNSVDDCTVSCAAGGVQSGHGNGTITCG